MDYKTYIDNDAKIICCTLEGELDIEESISLSRDLRWQASKLDFNVFYDACQLCVPASVMPAYDFSTKLSSVLDTSTHRTVRVAFLYKPGYDDEQMEVLRNCSSEQRVEYQDFYCERRGPKMVVRLVALLKSSANF